MTKQRGTQTLLHGPVSYAAQYYSTCVKKLLVATLCTDRAKSENCIFISDTHNSFSFLEEELKFSPLRAFLISSLLLSFS